MLRIAAVNQDRGISPQRNKGAAVHLVAMRDAFSALGHSVEGLDIPDDDSLLATLESEHSQHPFDLVYERYAIGKSNAARFASEHGIPLVLEVNAPLADEQAMFRDSNESREDQLNDGFLFSKAQCIVAVSSQVAEYAQSRGADPDAIMVCPNGIDLQRFNLQACHSGTRQELGLENKFVLGFHGRVRPWHGFDELVAVFHKLLKGELPVHLLIVGEGEFESLDSIPPGSYTRLGWQPHTRMPDFVAAFDALPLTYQPDMPCYFSPLKLMEAMACGAVPLVPDLGDLAQVVEHGKTGLVYRAGDSDALEAGLRKLINDPGTRHRMGQAAAAAAREYSWQAIADKILDRINTAGARMPEGSVQG